MPNRLDVVPLRIEGVGCVVAGMIVSGTRLAIVSSTVRNGSTVKMRHGLFRSGLKSQMHARCLATFSGCHEQFISNKEVFAILR